MHIVRLGRLASFANYTCCTHTSPGLWQSKSLKPSCYTVVGVNADFPLSFTVTACIHHKVQLYFMENNVSVYTQLYMAVTMSGHGIWQRQCFWLPQIGINILQFIVLHHYAYRSMPVFHLQVPLYSHTYNSKLSTYLSHNAVIQLK